MAHHYANPVRSAKVSGHLIIAYSARLNRTFPHLTDTYMPTVTTRQRKRIHNNELFDVARG
jgi:hypothetical protein